TRGNPHRVPSESCAVAHRGHRSVRHLGPRARTVHGRRPGGDALPLPDREMALPEEGRRGQGRGQERSVQMKRLGVALFACVLASALAGCAEMSRTEKTTVKGGAAGAAGGAIIGALAGNAGMGAAIGAGAGVVGGFLYGKHKDATDEAYEQGVREGE